MEPNSNKVTTTVTVMEKTLIDRKQCSSMLNPGPSGCGRSMASQMAPNTEAISLATNTGIGKQTPQRVMSANMPPHHHIRSDDTHEIESSIHADNAKSSRRGYYPSSDSSDRNKLPLYQRLMNYIPIKSRLLSCGIYFLLIILSIAILLALALLVYYLLNVYYHRIAIPINTGKIYPRNFQF